MRKLPFIERTHGPIGCTLESVDSQARIAVGPVAAYLARSHALTQGASAVARVVRAQNLSGDIDEPELISPTTTDSLLALVEAACQMHAESMEQFAEWIAVAGLADPREKSAPHPLNGGVL
ncbi:hypothetical protein [Caballeronia sp. BR00000012568055]|uniref:hypothetical protein n=1 Tax=Caballeronia sp. BR00000012568055 TaxID=2918761 RepID=UPI0023F9BCE1|nr:hypothetical protein [Caballeronia sp. BR00000012568055]